ncbi:hypothetical protein FOA52_004367 [Chlamydomonas sp. UWO 241]|nr:hypothetical protein FOA52_004367 [Chlamydomonas sp. UWO 241]
MHPPHVRAQLQHSSRRWSAQCAPRVRQKQQIQVGPTARSFSASIRSLTSTANLITFQPAQPSQYPPSSPNWFPQEAT